jgi:hypothetical protein
MSDFMLYLSQLSQKIPQIIAYFPCSLHLLGCIKSGTLQLAIMIPYASVENLSRKLGSRS